MKRTIGLLRSFGLTLGVGVAACGAPSQPQGPEPAQAEGAAWMATPRIDSVIPQPSGGVVVRGEAAPGARVILSGGDGAVMAAGADARGRFELHVGVSAIGQVLTPEIQIGQSTTPGPGRLLLAGEGGGLAALLTDGGSSLRLTPGPALDVVDGDGRGLTVSGRAAPGERIMVQAERARAQALTDPRGRWTIAVPNVGDRSVEIGVAGRVFRYPGPGASTDRAERAGGGWRVTRALSDVARQTSWFPDENAEAEQR